MAYIGKERRNGAVTNAKLYFRMGEAVTEVKGLREAMDRRVRQVDALHANQSNRLKSLEDTRSRFKGGFGLFAVLASSLAALKWFDRF